MTLHSWLRRIGTIFRAHRMEADLDAELEAHLALAADEYSRQGMTPEEARHAAYRSFGAKEAIKDTLRDRRSIYLVDSLIRDFHQAIRALSRSPQHTTLTISTLALGIAAVTIVSAFVHEILVRPLPFYNPEELVMLWTSIPEQNIERDGTAYAAVQDWRKRTLSFGDMAVVSRAETGTLFTAGEPEPIRVARVSANLFTVVGVSPALGRTFSQSEEDERQPVALLSYAFWKSRFGGTPQALGQKVRTEDGVLEVIGVMPPEFRFPGKETQLWEPHTLPSYWPRVRYSRGSDTYKVIARLRPGVTRAASEQAINRVAQDVASDHPDAPPGAGVIVVPLAEQMTGRTIPIALKLLFAAVIGMMMIACANVAGLLLAQALAREREFAIRTAIGAGRLRLIQQLILESLVLALIACAVGIAAGAAGIRLVTAAVPLDLPHVETIGISLTAVAFSFGFSLVTVVACGLVPALRLSAASPSGSLKVTAGTSSSARGNMRRMLVAGELAIATALVIGTGLLVRSFLNVQNTDPGFETERVVSVRVTLPASYDRTRGASYFADAMERLKSLPGVVAAGAVHELFFEYNPDTVITIEGSPPPKPHEPTPQLIGDAIAGEYFQAMGVPLLRGRLPSRRDTSAAPAVTVINETMARTFFPGGDPVGKRFAFGLPDAQSRWITIVGVVGDMHRRGLEAPVVSQMFGSLEQFPNNRMDVVVRTALSPDQLSGAIRDKLREIDKSALLSPPRIVKNQLASLNSWRSFQTWLMSTFASVALLLAGLGVYGLLQQILAQRRKEIGVRMALGASAAQVRRLVLRQAIPLVAIGLGAGTVAALIGARTLRSLLFEITEHDVPTIASTVILLLVCAAAASWLPSRRASQTDPVLALRED